MNHPGHETHDGQYNLYLGGCLKALQSGCSCDGQQSLVWMACIPRSPCRQQELSAWSTTTSQQGMREMAMQGLTRLLVACPDVLTDFLPDFLSVNDAYVVEAVLVAVLGLVVHGHAREAAICAAQRVLYAVFPEGNARWCHLTIRHYARRIVESVHARGWLPEADLEVVRPPYRSNLALDELPDMSGLKGLDDLLWQFRKHSLFVHENGFLPLHHGWQLGLPSV